MKIASLAILAWKRPEMLWSCLQSIRDTADFPYEIIVNLDGGDYTENLTNLLQLFSDARISKLILIGGKNRGMGNALQNCLGVAEGQYIFKIDGDLIFKPGWLSTGVSILDNNEDVGAVSFFNYRHYSPDDSRFNIDLSEHRNDCFIVDDFVSSIFGFRNYDNTFPRPMANDGFHQDLKKQYGKLAITKEDLVTNQGFGLGKSVYVIPDQNGEPTVETMYGDPLIFQVDKK